MHLLLECPSWNSERESLLGADTISATNLITSWGNFDTHDTRVFNCNITRATNKNQRGRKPPRARDGGYGYVVIPLHHGMPKKRQRELLEQTTMLRVAKFLEAADRKRVAEDRTAQAALGLTECLDPTGYD